jgi:hypothetical protein
MTDQTARRPEIAIVGSFDPNRAQELGLKKLDIVHQAAEDLGRELAKQGCSIVVYSSTANTLEIDVVKGFLSQKETPPGSVKVIFSQAAGQPSFGEEAANGDKFDFRPDFNPDWEFSFYQSLGRVDGMVILGGGAWALIAGVVATGHRKPMLACSAFGGAGDKIWRTMRVQEYPVTDEDFALMGRTNWSADLAARLVGLLEKQRNEFARRQQELLEQEDARVEARHRQELTENATINWHATISAVLFALAVFAWPATSYIGVKSEVSILFVVLLTPIIAGASGATIRVVLDWATGVTRTFTLSTYSQYILLRYAALGIVAGGLAGVSFVLAQIFSGGATGQKGIDPQVLGRLVPFLIIIGFAAGLTAEVVLSNLRKSPPPIEVPVPKKS